MSTIKHHAHSLIDALPGSAAWDDVARAVDQARSDEAVLAGIAAADAGSVLAADQLKAMFARWGVDVAV